MALAVAHVTAAYPRVPSVGPSTALRHVHQAVRAAEGALPPLLNAASGARELAIRAPGWRTIAADALRAAAALSLAASDVAVSCAPYASVRAALAPATASSRAAASGAPC